MVNCLNSAVSDNNNSLLFAQPTVEFQSIPYFSEILVHNVALEINLSNLSRDVTNAAESKSYSSALSSSHPSALESVNEIGNDIPY